MSFTKILLAVGAMTTLITFAPDARAQACKTTADCGKGLTCVLVPQPVPLGAPTCAPDDPKCAAIGAPAPAVDAGTMDVSGFCEPGPCATDADCGATMVCHTDMIPECPAGGTAVACAPNTKCDVAPPPPSPCTTKSVSTCMYKWQLPCSGDADCGDGFTCAPNVTTSCSGSGGTGSADAGVASGPTPVTSGGTGTGTATPGSTSRVAAIPPSGGCVTSPPTFPGWCTPKATVCAVDADCPATWTCVDPLPTRAASGPATPTDAGTGIAVGEPSPSGGSTGSTTPVPVRDRICASPLGTFGGAKDANGNPIETTGGGTTGAGGGTGTSRPGAPAPMASGSAGTASSGCALGGGSRGPSLVFSALALLGLVIARRKR